MGVLSRKKWLKGLPFGVVTAVGLLAFQLLASMISTDAVMAAAAAPSVKTDMAAWNQFFDGEPSGLGADWKNTGGDDEFPDDEERWVPSGQPIPFKTWIRGYSTCQKDVDTLFGLLADYDKKFRALEEKSAEGLWTQINTFLTQKPASPCADVLRRAYLVGALSIGPTVEGNESVTFQRNDLIVYATFILNQNVIIPLTPQKRDELAAGKKSLWTEKKDGEYLLSGVYSCEHPTIYLSSTLRPFNAAASLAHELDHLYRDKGGYELMWDWINNKDVRSFVISDEILASLYGAHYQRNQFMMDRAASPKNDYTRLGDEFNLFTPQGPLAKLMDLSGLSAPQTFYEFYGLVAQEREKPQYKEKLCALDKLVRTGYFHNPQGSCALKGIFPNATWFTTESYLTQIQQMRRDPKKLADLMKHFAEWQKALQGPSEVCEATVAAEKGGVLSDYLGSELTGHPGNSGVKPCLRVKF